MNNLYIKEVPGKGRGVFSTKDIKVGDIVEISPVVVFSRSPIETEGYIFDNNGQKVLLKKEMILPENIKKIIFDWGFLTKNGKTESCIALGYGSLYNSANPSNMRYESDEKNQNLLFIAVIDIHKNCLIIVLLIKQKLILLKEP